SRNGGSRGRRSLRRGPSSSSTSDNNSDATYTDSEMPLHRRAGGQTSQSRESTLRESPPEPAPPAVPPRNGHPPHQADSPLATRLGFIESQSEAPYVAAVLGSANNGASGQTALTAASVASAAPQYSSAGTLALPSLGRWSRSNALKINVNKIKAVLFRPKNKTASIATVIKKIGSASSLPFGGPDEHREHTMNPLNCKSDKDSGPGSHGSTYSNPLPELLPYTGTPCSTTGPMVPVPSCVNPQLIQQSSACGQGGPPATHATGARASLAATSAFASAAMASSRFHLQKACGGHRCSWRWATLLLTCVVVVLAATLAYFAGKGPHRAQLREPPSTVPSSSAGSSSSSAASKASPSSAARPPTCRPLLPGEVDAYSEAQLGVRLTRHLDAHESWNLWFNQPDSAFVRFNVTAP
ncbi:unnamed protein product, partial [Ixodes hexagonus]